MYGTYTHTWNKAHNFTALAGYQYRGARDTHLKLEQLNLLSENLSSFANATGEITRSQSISEWRNSGFFGRVNYDYKSRYLLEVSARYDGTSVFAAITVGCSCLLLRRLAYQRGEFWEPIRDVVDNTKIRLSYGKLANQHGVDEYAYLEGDQYRWNLELYARWDEQIAICFIQAILRPVILHGRRSLRGI